MNLLLTVSQAAALLALSRAKTWELVGRGDIPSVKVDGSRRIRVTDLERYVEALESESGDEGRR